MPGTRRPPPPGEDTLARGGTDSASRWLSGIGQDMITLGPPNTWNFGNGPRDSHTLVSRDLISQDAQGNWVTPRYNIRGSFENESQFGGPWHNAGYLTLAALAAGGAGLGAAAGAGTEGLDLSLMTPLTQGTYTPIAADVAIEGAGTAGATAAAGGGGGGAIDTSLLPPLDSPGPYTPVADTPTFDPVAHLDPNGPETGGGGGEGPGGGSSGVTPQGDWWDTVTSALDKLSGLKGLPGILSSLGGGHAQPGAGAVGGGSMAGASMGAGGIPRAGTAGHVDALQNPYATTKINQAGTLLQYLRGA